MKNILEAVHELRNRKDPGISFVNSSGNIRNVTSADLINQAQKFAGGLRKIGAKEGEPVILVMTEPESAIIAILGCMIAQCPPTPVYPPLNLAAISGFLKFITHVASRSGATFVIADPQPYGILGNVTKHSPPIRGVAQFSDVMMNAQALEIPQTFPDTAFLQFTSGSTSTPKGVMVQHSGLAANLEMIRTASHMNPDSCVVTWLPVYHDMGLIGTVLNAITLPCRLVVIPPIVFLKHPKLWLEMMTRFRGTHTAAPNFAFGLCARRVSDKNGIDLGSMTTFICGSEPVLPKTMEDFVNHFLDAGLNPAALVPAYGLAEATLAVTFTPHLRGLRTDCVDLEALTAGRNAVRLDDDVNTVRIASCGVPMPGLSVRIASENGQQLAERKIGEIQVSGPSVSKGYIGDKAATRESRSNDGWLKTGDLGYMADGELYACGRIKDVIIVSGKNYHAHDLESAVAEVNGVRTGNVVAFSSRNDDGESLVVIAETRNEQRSAELGKEIRNHLAKTIGISPDHVMVVPPATLPKTSSGKLKRSETKLLYEKGELGKKTSTFTNATEVIKSKLGFLRRHISG
ncbi:fatty acyl-AMP ligase [bacterium]|nr:fatty acyl-AMP ligase [bacterium]